MDFNTQRKIVKKLKEAGKKPLLFLPCLIARFVVVIFMSICRAVDMALSDSEGNFLGIKRKAKAKKNFGAVPEPAAETTLFSSNRSHRRPVLPFRPLWQRAMSLMLACAFVTMSAEITASADTGIASSPYVAPSKELITASELTSVRSSIYEADLYTNYKSDSEYPLQIESGAFNGMPNLTTITLGYSDGMSVGANNFTNIAPDAAVYIRTDSKQDYEKAAAEITSTSVSKIWDKNGQTYSEIPKDISVLTSYSGVGKVILKWDNITPEPDGYSIYTYESGTYKRVTQILTEKAVAGDSSRTHCSAEISASSNKSQIYAVRAFRSINADYDGDGSNDVNVPLLSKRFARSGSAAPLTAGKPELTTSMSNKTVTVNISLPVKSSEPSFIILYCKDEGETLFSPRKKILPSEMTNGTYSFEDPADFMGTGVRSYEAVAYYDVMNQYGSLLLGQFVYPEKDTSSVEFTTTRSKTAKITDAVLNSPTELKAELTADKKMWVLSWKRPEQTSGFEVFYSVSVNGRPVISETNRYTSDFAKINVDDPNITPGENVEFTVTAHADGMTSGTPAKYTVSVDKSNSVILNDVEAGNERLTVTFSPFVGTMLYTIYLTHPDSEGTLRTDTVKVSESDCTKEGKLLSYTINNLTNNIPYTVSVCSDAQAALYSSKELTKTPSQAPQPPQKLSVKPMENSAVLTWDIVKMDGTDDPVTGYYVAIYRESGENTVPRTQVKGLNSFTPKQKLENDIYYFAEVESYVELEDGTIIPSVTKTRSELFMPTVQVDNVLNLTVTPADKVMNISWTAVKGASEYILMRTDPDGSQREIYKGNKTSCTDDRVDNKTEYSYKVMAIRNVDGKDYPGEYSSEQKGMINYSLSSVQGLTAAGGDGCINLKWDKVNGADGYYVQYSNKDANSWTTIAKVGTPAYTHTGLMNGDVYDYRVIPYVIINGKEESGDSFAQKVTGKAGINLAAPADFTVTAGDGQITLKWSAVKGAEGYCVYIVGYDGSKYLLDKVTKTTAIHTNLSNNTTLTYAVCAYKYVDETLVEGDFSVYKTATVGVELNAPTDVTAKAGKEQISLSWKKSDGAEGYVVYAYNIASLSFTPVGIVTKTSFVHTGLIAGREYTYMIAAYKNVNGQTVYSGYSLAVTATPESSGNNPSTDNSNVEAGDFRIFITGTTPFGMSNSDLISAFAGQGAFNSDIDVRFTLSPDTVTSVQNVLNFYGEGIDSFLIYPMDISLYVAGTNTRASVNPGYYLTLTIPVPDELLPYSEHISVVHVSDLDQLEILPSIHVNVGGVDCMQFTANSFSPYAFVVYLPEIGEDTGAGTPVSAQGTSGPAAEGQSSVFTFRNTYLPTIYRRRARNKHYRIVRR